MTDALTEMDVLLDAIQEAGSAIIKLQCNPLQVTHKSNNDSLTAADLLANDILKERLCGTFSSIGWLSEETLDNPHRLTCQRVWVVDPIDGTKEFVKGIPEYVISVALIEHGLPILGAIYNPATSQLFHAIKGQGAWLNAAPISCKPLDEYPLKILASRHEVEDGSWEPFKEHADIQAVGSIAYKLALVAAGLADATFSLSSRSEWDIAAGVFLVQEAGGVVTDQFRRPFLFNQMRTRVNSIVACSQEADEIIHQLIAHAAMKVY